MLDLKEYTKEEVAKEFNIKADKAVNITRKLTQQGYSFQTSGRGQTYRILITAKPQQGLREFFKEYFNIDIRFEERTAHLLKLILSPFGNDLLKTTPQTISHFTYINKHLVKEYVDRFIEVGFLKVNEFEETYYATKRDYGEIENNGDYLFYYEMRLLTQEEYLKAYQAFYEIYDACMADIDNNPEMIPELALIFANSAKRDAIGGWWVCKDEINHPLYINKKWKHLPQLLSLLEQYSYQEYRHPYKGNSERDLLAWQKKWEDIERKLQEKKERMMKLEEENREYKRKDNEQKREIEELIRMVESLLKREQTANTNKNSPLLEMLQVKTAYPNSDDMFEIIKAENKAQEENNNKLDNFLVESVFDGVKMPACETVGERLRRIVEERKKKYDY